ncbi:hypothetical protein B0J15DRAFT_582028 [Fusarium solani]|uniref:Uncharacterized protein n=1 Tax=Fusarium solani TaxID=169388 RepID=A0A9P9HLW7_FUSSL|nr:uncharacterized protein B0J15DRAFT_582028 [Fusarium solani]KAH7259970.1 hypothetical protein B0J15DRAFT_582028 [Fusarium solani]
MASHKLMAAPFYPLITLFGLACSIISGAQGTQLQHKSQAARNHNPSFRAMRLAVSTSPGLRSYTVSERANVEFLDMQNPCYRNSKSAESLNSETDRSLWLTRAKPRPVYILDTQ